MNTIELKFKNERTVFMFEEDLVNENGPLMPTATHYKDTFGLGTSWAYMFDGVIKQFGEEIGSIGDLTLPYEIVQ